MNIFNVLLPILVSIFYFLLFLFIPIGSFLFGGALSYSIFYNRSSNKYDNQVFGLDINLFVKVLSVFLMIVFFICYIAIFNIFSSSWIRANPMADYKSKIQNASSVVVFGFGLGEDKDENTLPGTANMELHKWINNNIQDKIVIGQYGNMLAQKTNPSSNSFMLMHGHNPDEYINTYESAVFAFNKLDSLYNLGEINRDVIVVAHDMQLQRAVWILEKLSDNNKEWQKYNFIVPNVPKIQFSLSSTQFHTKLRFIYNCVELFYSRPRDYFKKGVQ